MLQFRQKSTYLKNLSIDDGASQIILNDGNVIRNRLMKLEIAISLQ